MFDKFYEDNFVFLEDDLELSLIQYCYKESASSEYMNDQDYKTSMQAYGERVQMHKHTLLLVDMQNSQFAISPELQEWTAKEIAPMTMSLRRLAFVMSPDIFSQVSLEQMMEEDGIAESYKPHYFDNIEEAKKWLFSER